MAEPLRYYKNVTVATTYLLEAMQAFGVTKVGRCFDLVCTKRLLRSSHYVVCDAWPVCPQLVYSSTCAVYGNQEVLPITEDSPPNPNSNYGQVRGKAIAYIMAVRPHHPLAQVLSKVARQQMLAFGRTAPHCRAS
jgi:UDP-glucose 4-epimerase